MSETVDITCKIRLELREEFKALVLKKRKTIREVLPEIIQQWVNKNKGR